MPEYRLKLILGKFPVTEVSLGTFKIKIGNQYMTANLPPLADVRQGDLLTFYAEVLIANPKGIS